MRSICGTGLPELWQLVCSGGLRVWRARRVAQATRHLGLNAAMHVDSAVAPAIVSLPRQRFETMLQAKIIERIQGGRRTSQGLGGGTVRANRPRARPG